MFTIPQTQIFYSNNATTMSADTAGAISWVRDLVFLKCLFSHLYIQMGPSITPLTNLNSGFRVYEVDSAVRKSVSTLTCEEWLTFLRLSRLWMHTRSWRWSCTTSYWLIIIIRWRSDVNTFPSLDSQIAFGPAYAYEYNTRETYGGSITGWDADDPLNATWWHRVTEGIALPLPFWETRNMSNGKYQQWKPIRVWSL